MIGDFMGRSEEEKRNFDSDGDDEFVNKQSDDIYSDEDIEEQMAADEIEPGEAGFMEGYGSPNLIMCKKCKKKIKKIDLEKCHEEEIDGKTTWVCEDCYK